MPLDTPREPQDAATSPYSDEARDAFATWLLNELESAIADRTKQQQQWETVDRLYSPQRTRLTFPVDGAYEYPVPIAAIACDALYAQAFDLIFSLDPPVVVRATRKGNEEESKEAVEDAKALQTWLDWKLTNDLNFKEAASHGLLSTCKKGNGIYYTPYVEVAKKTRAGVKQLLPRTPIYALPLDDFFLPGGRNVTIDNAPWVAARFWYSRARLRDFIATKGWDIDVDMLTPRGGDKAKQSAENAAKTSTTKLNDSETQDYQIFLVHAQYDIDNDGYLEDLLAYYDYGSGTLLHLQSDPYDHRPFANSQYQIREHFFYALGIVEMLQPFQEEATDTHTQRNINMRLVNTRMFAGPDGVVQGGTVRVWPGKYMAEPTPGAIREIKLTDVYPSSDRTEVAALSLAERRVGANELAVPRPSQLLGSRTPTGTATIGMAQVNRRFAPAFDSMRRALADAVKHSLFRDQEQLLARNTTVEQKINKAIGPELAERVIALLRDDQFDEAFRVELHATTANMNREVERQNHLFLLQVLAGYYDRLLQMSQLAAQPGVSPEMISIIQKVMSSATELIQRILRSFDQMRDPETFLVRLDDELTNLEADATVGGFQGIQNLLQGALSGGLDGGSANPLPFGNT